MLNLRFPAYFLARNCYDIFLSNARGNRYSRAHKIYDPDKDKEKFWKFSWHEIGIYDLPAVIDFVLNLKNAEKLFYVGHSQGTTTFYVLTSERPEYNDKILAHFSYAPSAFMKNVKSLPLHLLANLVNILGVSIKMANRLKVLIKACFSRQLPNF